MSKMITRLFLILMLTTFAASSLMAQSKGKKVVAKKLAKPKPAFTKLDIPDEPWRLIKTKERLVEITTDYGVMIAKLYDSTPLHRDNFIKLVQQKFYDSLMFHRVIDGFMIQGGDPASKNAAPDVMLGNGSAPGDRVPAEFKPNFFHKKGALAAARDNNPEKASSNCQFYIVQGKPVAPQELDDARITNAHPGYAYSKSQKEIYTRLGGTPFLDQNYTVFGEVISGLDVIDKIAKVNKGNADRPVTDVRMKMRLIN